MDAILDQRHGQFCLNAGCGSGPNFSTGTTMTFGYLIFTNTNGSVALGVDNYSVSITNNNSAGLSCNMLTTPNLVDNPGFETGTVGSTTIPNWTVAWTDPFFQIAITPHGGLQSLAMGSIPGANRVTQTIPTVAGQEYMVCFWLLNGTPLLTVLFKRNGTASIWSKWSITLLLAISFSHSWHWGRATAGDRPLDHLARATC